MSTKIRKFSIEADTAILPYAVADGVIGEAEMLIGRDLPNKESFVDKLEKHANDTYTANSQFRKQIRAKGDLGRDQLYMWMRHWLSSEIKREYPGLHNRIPQSFSNGEFTSENEETRIRRQEARFPASLRNVTYARPSLPPGTKKG